MGLSRVAAPAIALILAATAFGPAASRDGPSFDCRKARTWVEKTICRDPELADKDVRMAMAYRDLVEQAREGGGPGTDLSNFQREQKAWLRERNRCRTRACLNAAYDRRIDAVTVDYDE